MEHRESFDAGHALSVPQRVDWAATRSSLNVLGDEECLELRAAYLRHCKEIEALALQLSSSGSHGRLTDLDSTTTLFALSSATQLTFTLPPTHNAYHLRFKVLIDGKVMPNHRGEKSGCT